VQTVHVGISQERSIAKGPSALSMAMPSHPDRGAGLPLIPCNFDCPDCERPRKRNMVRQFIVAGSSAGDPFMNAPAGTNHHFGAIAALLECLAWLPRSLR